MEVFFCLFVFLGAGNDQNARAGSGEGSGEVWRVDMKEVGGGKAGRGAMGKGRLGGGNGEGETGRGQQGGGYREGETGSGRPGGG